MKAIERQTSVGKEKDDADQAAELIQQTSESSLENENALP